MYLWCTGSRDLHHKRDASLDIEWRRRKISDEFMSLAIKTTFRSADDLAAPGVSLAISAISGQAQKVMVCG